jgi:hypothetical protein
MKFSFMPKYKYFVILTLFNKKSLLLSVFFANFATLYKHLLVKTNVFSKSYLQSVKAQNFVQSPLKSHR